MAVDDVQWLDRSSADVLSFVARRLGDDPVALLLAQRTDEASGVPLELDRAFGERLWRVRPRPLSLGATHRLLRSHLGLTLPRPAARRVHAACGGNPFFALEIGRMLTERPEVPPTNEPLPVPRDVQQLVGRRIKRLSRPGREAVLAAALLREPTAAVVEQAAEKAGLEEAQGAGILVADGEALRFAHPLLAEAATSLTPGSRRREMHLRLAELLADPEVHAQHLALEERARHLALAAGGPDPDVASALDEASQLRAGPWRAGRGRGALGACLPPNSPA